MKMRSRQLLAAVSSWSLTVLLIGCSNSGPPVNPDVDDLGIITGNVTYNGKPVIHGAIEFFKGGTKVVVASIEKDGSYSTMLLPGEFDVAIETMIEPREVAKLVKEGPPELIGATGGKVPIRKKNDGAAVKKFDEYERLPLLADLISKNPSEKAAFTAVQKKYGKVENADLKLTVRKGPITRNFELN